MCRSLPLLLFAVVLPGSLSPALYGRLFPDETPVVERTVAVVPPIEVVAVEAPPPVLAWEDRMCVVRAERSRALWGNATDRLKVRAGTGSLVVRGVDDVETIRVSALLCASDLERLAAMDVDLRRVMGPDLLVETVQPDPDGALGWSDDEYARIDLLIEVPRGMATSIVDGSGPVTVTGVGDLTLEDGAGEIEIGDVAGNVRLEDGSGSIRLSGVRGDVSLRDGSGSVEIQDVAGSVAFSDVAGAFEAAGVVREAGVPQPGPIGIVSVRRVGGDLSVSGDGGREIRHDGVEGRVSLPGRRGVPPR